MKIKRHILRVISMMLAAALVFSGVLFLGSDEYVYAQENFTADKYTKDYTTADNNFTIPNVEGNTIKYQVTVGKEGESKTYIYGKRLVIDRIYFCVSKLYTHTAG